MHQSTSSQYRARALVEPADLLGSLAPHHEACAEEAFDWAFARVVGLGVASGARVVGPAPVAQEVLRRPAWRRWGASR